MVGNSMQRLLHTKKKNKAAVRRHERVDLDFSHKNKPRRDRHPRAYRQSPSVTGCNVTGRTNLAALTVW